MKYTILFLIVIISQTSLAFEYETWVKVRHPKKTKTYNVRKQLTELESDQAYDGKYFKIVKAKEEAAIRFDHPDLELQLKAATVYYHLMIARNFWVNEMKAKKVKQLPKLTIRIDMPHGYSDLGHFENDAAGSEYNNALSIPAGSAPDYINNLNAQMNLPLINPWNEEIWYRPMQRINTQDINTSHLGDNPLTEQLRDLQTPILNYSKRKIRNETVQALFYDRYKGPYWQSLAWNAGSWAILKVIIEGSRLLDPVFMEKWYYLDTALIPEVTYHEFSHIALSDHLEMSHSTAAVEGLADYFAAMIAKRSTLYEKVKGHSTSLAKELKNNKTLYRPYFEHINNAHGDFVVGVLWDIYEEMPEVAPKLIYKAREHFNTKSSSIDRDLLNALLTACNSVCKNPLKGRNRLYEIFSNRGF